MQNLHEGASRRAASSTGPVAQPSPEPQPRTGSPERPARLRRARHSLQAKLSLIFTLLAVVSLAIGTVVLSNLEQVSLDARKFLEETREARLADQMILALDKLTFISTTD